jgi:hypothetical protein
MAVSVLLVRQLFHQAEYQNEENHCEVQSCTGTTDEKS